MEKCPLCHGEETKKHKKNVSSVYSDRPYDLFRCGSCGFVFTFPEPDKETLNDIYKNKYSYDVHLLIRKEKEYRAKKFAGFAKKEKGAGKVLEIGTMYGFLIESLQKSGFECTGLEIDKDAVIHCREKGLDVRKETLEIFLEKNREKYNLIVMSHVLEHIADPKAYLKKMESLLNENGKIMLIVPNASSFLAKIFGKYWGYWQAPVHINHFNRKSLRHLLGSLDFEIANAGVAGGDSLLFLSTLANLVGAKSEKIKMGEAKNKFVKIFSAIAKHWYWLGDDDLIISAEKRN